MDNKPASPKADSAPKVKTVGKSPKGKRPAPVAPKQATGSVTKGIMKVAPPTTPGSLAEEMAKLTKHTAGVREFSPLEAAERALKLALNEEQNAEAKVHLASISLSQIEDAANV